MEARKTYAINKGIGRSVEFKGLKAQYLFIFAGGLLAVLILVMILYTVGVQPYLCLGLGVGLASLVVWQTFSLNQKYGEYGLMKKAAHKRHPRYLRNQKSVRFLQTQKPVFNGFYEFVKGEYAAFLMQLSQTFDGNLEKAIEQISM